MERYNAALARFLSAEEAEWEAVVAAHRPELQRPFFEHLQCLVAAAKDDEGACRVALWLCCVACGRRGGLAFCPRAPPALSLPLSPLTAQSQIHTNYKKN